MNTLDDLQAEAYARQHLQSSGIAQTLKTNQIYIWYIRAYTGKLLVGIDVSQAKGADLTVIEDEIQQFLSPLQRTIEVKDRPIESNCCYGVCHGCLNGDPNTQPLWVGPPFCQR